MSLRDQLLAENHGDIEEAAAIFALGLTRGDPDSFKVGYTVENAILAAVELFPEVTEDRIRFLNGRHGWMRCPHCAKSITDHSGSVADCRRQLEAALDDAELIASRRLDF